MEEKIKELIGRNVIETHQMVCEVRVEQNKDRCVAACQLIAELEPSFLDWIYTTEYSVGDNLPMLEAFKRARMLLKLGEHVTIIPMMIPIAKGGEDEDY